MGDGHDAEMGDADDSAGRAPLSTVAISKRKEHVPTPASQQNLQAMSTGGLQGPGVMKNVVPQPLMAGGPGGAGTQEWEWLTMSL